MPRQHRLCQRTRTAGSGPARLVARRTTQETAKLFSAAGQQITIRVYQTGTIRRDEQKIKFQLYSPEKHDFFDKFVAYAAAAVGNELHRQHSYVVRMNYVPEYPRILEIVAEVKGSDLVVCHGLENAN